MQIQPTTEAIDCVRRTILQRYAPAGMSIEEVEADPALMDEYSMCASEIIAKLNELLAIPDASPADGVTQQDEEEDLKLQNEILDEAMRID